MAKVGQSCTDATTCVTGADCTGTSGSEKCACGTGYTDSNPAGTCSKCIHLTLQLPDKVWCRAVVECGLNRRPCKMTQVCVLDLIIMLKNNDKTKQQQTQQQEQQQQWYFPDVC